MKRKTSSILILAFLLIGTFPAVLTSAVPPPFMITSVEDQGGSPVSGGVYGDTVVVKGIGATASSTVNLYWDKPQAWDGEMGLLNTTSTDAWGEFAVWFDVPNVTGGVHYIWVQDVSTGININSPFEVHPHLVLSSGAESGGNTVTVKGYGFGGWGGFEDVSLILLRDPASPNLHRSSDWVTADGVQSKYSLSLSGTPISPGNLYVHYFDTEIVYDKDEDGSLDSYDGMTGTLLKEDVGQVNYVTGDLEVEFERVPPAGVLVNATYRWFRDDPDDVYVFPVDTRTTPHGSFNTRVTVPGLPEMAQGSYSLVALDDTGNTDTAPFLITDMTELKAETLHGAPLTGVPMRMDGTSIVTPVRFPTVPGKYIMVAKRATLVQGFYYGFSHWQNQDGTVLSTRRGVELWITGETIISAVYALQFCTLNVHVQDPTGAPLEADVTIDGNLTQTTDINGDSTFSIPSGKHTIKVEHPEYITQRWKKIILNDLNLDVQLEEKPTLHLDNGLATAHPSPAHRSRLTA